MGSAVLEWMDVHGFHPQIERLGIPDQFIEHGKVAELYHICGIDVESIANCLSNII
jgi:1-deoxy-D-xylulose-5-phosphate synthase